MSCFKHCCTYVGTNKLSKLLVNRVNAIQDEQEYSSRACSFSSESILDIRNVNCKRTYVLSMYGMRI